MSDAGNNGRDEKGRLLPGNAIRKTGAKMKARVVSRRLKSEMIRRYQYKPLDEENPGEPIGKERAVLMHYFWMMDIAQNKNEKASDRIKAATELANRMDGKPVETVDLAAMVETSSPLDKAVSEMTPEKLLELIRAVQGR